MCLEALLQNEPKVDEVPVVSIAEPSSFVVVFTKQSQFDPKWVILSLSKDLFLQNEPKSLKR
jgi:hypothetical protein